MKALLLKAVLLVCAPAKARFEKAQAEYQTKLARREATVKESGKKPGGKPPKPPAAGPKAQDQLNFQCC